MKTGRSSSSAADSARGTAITKSLVSRYGSAHQRRPSGGSDLPWNGLLEAVEVQTHVAPDRRVERRRSDTGGRRRALADAGVLLPQELHEPTHRRPVAARGDELATDVRGR